MRLQCVFSSHIDKIYDIAVGSTFSECFNEELDSAKIIITHVSKPNRLSDLKCYDYVYIYDLDNNDFKKYFLVDDFSETIQNVKEEIYDYTISLMSETKILEKKQLPNRVITHSLIYPQKTIAYYIEQFCTLYIPKVKYTQDKTTWFYKYIIDFSDITDMTSTIYQKFNVACPDMSFNQPTLRQALTQLMQVVGCLPIITNRKLNFLDLRATPSIFTLDNVNYITRSMASDSFVNTLINMGDNILDDRNEVISEVLGFRDKDNVYLKQTENLVLQTSKPIYNVIEFDICGYVTKTVRLLNLGVLNIQMSAAETDGWSLHLNTVDGLSTTLYNTVVIFAKRNITTGRLEEISRLTVGNLDTDDKRYNYAKPTGTEYFIAYGYTTNSTDVDKLCYLNTYISDNNYLTFSKDLLIYYFYQKDISKLLIEESKRNALYTDYTQIPSNPTTIDQIAEYYYCTVGYTIGTQKISGFSKTYSQKNGFWEKDITYIENIWNGILNIDEFGDKTTIQDIADYFLLVDGSFQILTQNTPKPRIYSPQENNALFSSLFFNIKYRPLNSLNIKYFKNSSTIDTTIEQLDTQEASIPSFDDMTNRELEKANRLGNNVYQISQRVSSPAYMNALNSVYDDDKIIFKREYSIYNDFVQVSYTASKDYVLKNYFTSIQTKYRAYEYVDYNKSVVRKENKAVFVLISEYYFDGDDNIWLGSLYNYNDHNEKSLFLSGAIAKSDEKDNLIYFTYADDILSTMPFKNEVSNIVAKNMLVFNYQDVDNASAGTYIKNLEVQNTGLPQAWAMFSNEFYSNKKVGFIGKVNFVSDENIFDGKTSVDTELIKVYNEPKTPINVFNPPRNDTPNIWLVNSNAGGESISSPTLTDGKDYSEIINRTLEFVYYTTNSDIEWTQKFIELCEFYDYETLNRNNKILLSAGDITLTNDLKSASGVGYIAFSTNYIELDTTTNSKVPFIKIKWSNIGTQYKYLEIINLVGNNYYDVIKFRRPDDTATTDSKFYITLNDNKSENVYTFDYITNLWYIDYKVAKNTLDRTLSLDTKEFRVSLVYFTQDCETLEDFDKNKVYFNTEVENL